MVDAEPYGSEGDGGEEVSRELVIARGDAPEVLEPVEEAFDEVALAVNLAVNDTADPDVALRRDVSEGASGFDERDNGGREVAAVGNDVTSERQSLDQGREGGLVRGLAGGEQQAHRQAVTIHHDVDFGGQSSTRTADGVIRAPFLPPAACWWARTIEESIR